jgi:tetratricopeptide (TPR) repeat protein
MMNFNARDWPVISALFDEALELPSAERDRWLAALPADRRVHLHTLEMLLADHAHVQTRDFLNTLPKVGAADEAPVETTDDRGRIVGPYRLQHELGRGGMGSVWLAERTDGLLRRAVALKLPHPGLATRAFAERLARERDILASLAHPHIARLYDAGVSDDGQPYIALEYVQGLTLIEHCQTRQLDLRARIALFRQVLDAVQYAHAHLVIHRDLKPSNVLVGDDGQAHLLDFGIAKLLIDGQAEAGELTLAGHEALTPDYASPEQIVGTAVSTASDVYSLGVLLFELLAGERPYHLQRHGRETLARSLAELDVPSPSSVAHAAGDAFRARALRGDLDTIVLKALKKNPAERYPTADAFDQDLRRYLDGAPVAARPDSVGYRVGKFVRRHRFGVAAASLVVIALAAGLAGTVWQAQRASQQAERAQAVQDFLIGLFNEADPIRARGRELTARDMLDAGRRDLLVKLADQPRLSAVLDGVLVDLYTKLSDEAKALPLAETRRDLALRLDGPHSLSYGDALYALARVHGGLNHHQTSLEIYGQAREVLRHYEKERSGELLLMEGHMAGHLMMLERASQAAEVLVALLPKLAARFGPDSWELLRSEAALAGVYSDLHENAKVTELIARIGPKLDRLDEGHRLQGAEMRVDLGYAAWNDKDYPVAETQLTRGIADADRLLGTANTLSVDAQRTLGLLYNAEGRYDRAAETYLDSVRRGVQLSGEDSSSTRFAESFAVLPLVMLGRGDEALAMARRSMLRLDHIDGITPAIAIGFDRRLGLALLFAGDHGAATQVLERVLATEEKSDAKRGARSVTLRYLAGALAGQGRHEAAADAAARAATLLGQDTPNKVALAHIKLTEALARARLRQDATAQRLVDEARALLHDSAEASVVGSMFADVVHAEVLRSEGAMAEADRIDRDARDRLKAAAGVVLPKTPIVLI